MLPVKILLVEDENIEAMAIQSALESFGYQVPFIASSGEEAVAKALEINPDLILMDIVLKGDMNGLEAAFKIKKSNIPIIYLTAHSEETTLEKAKLTEPYGYLIKPYNKTELKYAIELALYKSKMEKELKESEKKYHSILENVLDAYLQGDKDGQIIMASPSAAEMFGYDSPEEMVGVNAVSLYKFVEDRQSILNKLKTEGKVLNKEVKALKKDDNSFWVSLNVQYTYNDEFEIIGTEAFVRDITTTKEVEKELEKKETYYRTIFEHTGTATALLEENYIIALVNTKFEQLSGYSREEIEGKKKWTDFVVKDDLEHMKELHNLRRDDPHAVPTVYDFRFRDRQGNIKNIHLDVDLIPGTTKSVASLLDITKIKELTIEQEKLLKHSEQVKDELSTLIDNIVDEVWFCNTEGEIILANAAARRFEQEANQEPHPQLNGLIKSVEVYNSHGAERPREGSPLLRALNGEVLKDLEEIVIFPSGKKQYRQVSSAPIRNEKGLIIGAVAVVRDITHHKKAEEDLIRSEKFLESIVENIPDMIFVKNAEKLDFNMLNKAGEKLLSHKKEELLGKTDYDFFPPDIADFFTSKDREVLENNKLLDIPQETILTKDQGQRILHTKKIPILNDDGAPEYLLGISEDITERVENEKTIIHAKEEWENTFNVIPDLISIMDTEYKIVRCNKSMADRLGIETSTCPGLSCYEVVHGLDEPPSFCPHSKLLKDQHEHETEIHEDLLEGDFLVTVSPLFDENGRLKGSVHVAHDITERNLVNKQIKKSEEKLRLLTDNMTDVVGQISPDGILTFLSPATEKITGFKIQDLIGTPVTSIIHPDDINMINKVIQEVISNKKTLNIEYRVFRKDNTFVWMEANGKGVYDSSGNIKSVVFTTRDITERKKVEKKLKSSLLEKESLLREIHHRVNNNMQIISSLLSLQTDTVPEESKNIIKDSLSRIKSMSMIHENLYQSTDLSHIDFNDYVENLVANIFYTYGIRIDQIKLEINVDDIDLNMETAVPLGLIINELISNSLKFAFPDNRKGKIIIELENRKDKNFLTVYDDGIGLPTDFDLEKTQSLGLQLVNNLIQQIDGKIELEQNQGTKYIISFNELSYKERLNL